MAHALGLEVVAEGVETKGVEDICALSATTWGKAFCSRAADGGRRLLQLDVALETRSSSGLGLGGGGLSRFVVRVGQQFCPEASQTLAVRS